PGGSGPRPPGITTWVRGARCNRSGANAGERSAAPEPKTATVERREASVPRHGKLQSDGALCDLMGEKRLIDPAKCCTLAPDRAWCYFTPLFRTLTGRGVLHDAQASQCSTRKRHRAPSPLGAQKTVLDDDQPRHPSRLSAKRRGRYVERARRRRRCRVDQAHSSRRRS